MSERSEAPTESSIALVALLDALGTKGILSHATPDGVMGTGQSLLDMLGKQCDQVVRTKECELCSYLAFSDTVVIYILPKTRDDMPAMLSAMAGLLAALTWTGMRSGIYFRGALSTGRFIKSASKMLGESLEEASTWYEKANWMGVMVTPSGGHLIEQLKLHNWDPGSFFVRAPVPLSGKPALESWDINWPWYAGRLDEIAKSGLLESFLTYSGSIVPEIAEKYSNTLVFADKIWGPQADN